MQSGRAVVSIGSVEALRRCPDNGLLVISHPHRPAWLLPLWSIGTGTLDSFAVAAELLERRHGIACAFLAPAIVSLHAVPCRRNGFAFVQILLTLSCASPLPSRVHLRT